MPVPNDLWYIRTPDGRVLKAADTGVVRQQLSAGRLPPGTHLRRSGQDEWHGIERYREFADLARSDLPDGAPVSIASRLDPVQLGMADIRGLLEELVAALASTLVRGKLAVALLAGLLLGVLAALASLPQFPFTLDPIGAGWLLVPPALLVAAWLSGMLARMTHVELSRLRPSRWRDGVSGLGLTMRLAVCYALAVLLAGGLIVGLRALPGQAQAVVPVEARSLTAWILIPLCIAAEALTWTLTLLLLPCATLLVVEELSFVRGLAAWLRLVRARFGRLLLAETLALILAMLLSLPLQVLTRLVATGAEDAPGEAALLVLRVTLAAVPAAYLLVANVFIYLKLRYETPERRG